jgi:hypothetical protein
MNAALACGQITQQTLPPAYEALAECGAFAQAERTQTNEFTLEDYQSTLKMTHKLPPPGGPCPSAPPETYS